VLASGSTLQVWDLASGTLLRTLEDHHHGLLAVTIAAGGQLVSAFKDGVLQVWDLSSGVLLRTVEGGTGPVTAVAIAPDGRVVSACEDGTLKVWRFANPVSESEYDYEPALDKVIERSADGKRYIVGVRNGELQRLQELIDEDKPHLLPRFRPLTSH
jgi:WD40 repeat protein